MLRAQFRLRRSQGVLPPSSRACFTSASLVPRQSAAPPATKATFANQSVVPRLPIPTLEETCQAYLKSLQPLLTVKEYEQSERAVQEFLAPDGPGPKLQKRLQDYDKQQPNSWLEELWFRKAYLEWREPIMINVNWWTQFKDTSEVKALLAQPPARGQYSETQVQRAAGLIANLLSFKRHLDAYYLETYPAETMGKKQIPLCMNQYRMQFGVCRVPAEGCDVIRQTFPSQAKHIVVLAEDQIYKVDVVGENGEIASLESLGRQLTAVTELVKLHEKKQPPVGVLTTEHRDTWTKMHQHLVKLSPENQANFAVIEDALFAVCLENYSTSEDIDASHRVWFHGANGRNRWFDKALSFIFMNNGRAGCSGEHSPSDAVIPANMISQVLKAEPAADAPSTKNLPLAKPTLLNWVVDKHVEEGIQKAEERAEKDIADVDSVLLHFPSYGGDKIKKIGKAGPDAFVQMALQLTYYRIYKKPCPTYESASTRQFLHGRTETIRVCTNQTVAFTKAFDDESIDVEKKLELLGKAIETQTKLTIAASSGRGCDRHLLGLRCMIQPKEETPALFQDPAYLKSMYFQLSSSNVSPGDYLYGGFGPVVPDGYGVNYAIGATNLKFSISSRRNSKDTCSRSFRKMLDQSLVDLMELVSLQPLQASS